MTKNNHQPQRGGINNVQTIEKTYRSLIQQTNVILATADPMRLMSDDTPGDEYTMEGEKILTRVFSLRDRDKIAEVVFAVFFESFEERLSPSCQEEISNKLLELLEKMGEQR